MKNATEMKNKCGWEVYDVLRQAEYQASAFGDDEVAIDENYETETTTITFGDGSYVVVNNADVEYFETPLRRASERS